MPWLFPLRQWGGLTIALIGKIVCIWLSIFSFLRVNFLILVLTGSDSGLRTLRHSCIFYYQRRVVKTFPGPGYIHSEAGVM